MSHTHQQAFIHAPVERVWELVADPASHPRWWPKVVEVECEGLEAGCTYREVVRTPFGNREFNLMIDERVECGRLAIHCLNTGTFVNVGMVAARGGTFAEFEMGMEPKHLSDRAFDAVAGRRFFRSWLDQTVAALEREASAQPAR